MTNLSDKQEAFAKEFVLNGGNATAAYRKAYNAEKMQEATISVKACELKKNGKVAVRILELKEEVAEIAEKEFKIDAKWVLEQAVKVYDRCMQAEQVIVAGEPLMDENGNNVYKFEHSGANKALEIVGKHVDVQAFKERVESTVTHKVDKTLAERLTGGSKK